MHGLDGLGGQHFEGKVFRWEVSNASTFSEDFTITRRRLRLIPLHQCGQMCEKPLRVECAQLFLRCGLLIKFKPARKSARRWPQSPFTEWRQQDLILERMRKLNIFGTVHCTVALDPDELGWRRYSFYPGRELAGPVGPYQTEMSSVCSRFLRTDGNK